MVDHRPEAEAILRRHARIAVSSSVVGIALALAGLVMYALNGGLPLTPLIAVLAGACGTWSLPRNWETWRQTCRCAEK